MGIAREKKKKTLKAKMLGILTMCAMTSLLAAGIVSYMALRMIQNDSIENNMKMYLDQITKNTDEAYYDMLSIVNCIFRKNRALAPHERSAVPLGTDHCPVG